MDDQSNPAAPAVDHGLQNRLDQIAAKVRFCSVYCRKTR
jgi:hypothetical protein